MEPLAYMYTDHNGEMFIQPNRANMDKRFWTETPLYREPVDLVVGIESLKRILLPLVMSLAETELVDGEPADDTVVIGFSGSGVSDSITYGEYKRLMGLANRALERWSPPTA